MANSNNGHTNNGHNANRSGDHAIANRLSTETKASTKTTEFFAYIAAVIATIVTTVMVGDGEGDEGGDMFNAQEGMELITYLTIAYMIARGLAKSGSRENYDA